MWRSFLAVSGAALVLVAPQPAGAADVAEPRFVRTIATGETGWFSSPALVDLDGDRRLEIVAPSYSTSVFDARGRLLGKGTATEGRVYAPSVVADLDGDGTREIVVGGNEGTVAAYVLAGGRLQLKPGWPASTCSGGQCPETRGLAAGDLDGDGRIEVVATTTNTAPTGSQVFVFDASGRVRARLAALRRGRRRSTASATTATARTARTSAIGQLDDDPQLEVVVTFDNHQINLFNHDGTSVLASPWFRNRQGRRRSPRLGAVHPLARARSVEDDHFHRRVGRLAGRARDAVAAVDRVPAVDRRPRPRRPQRGDRAPERRDERALRDAGLRVHGARRRPARRRARRRAGTRGSGGCR